MLSFGFAKNKSLGVVNVILLPIIKDYINFVVSLETTIDQDIAEETTYEDVLHKKF